MRASTPPRPRRKPCRYTIFNSESLYLEVVILEDCLLLPALECVWLTGVGGLELLGAGRRAGPLAVCTCVCSVGAALHSAAEQCETATRAPPTPLPRSREITGPRGGFGCHAGRSGGDGLESWWEATDSIRGHDRRK